MLRPSGLTMNSAGILLLAAEMNAFTKFVCMPMRGHAKVTGSDVVMRYPPGSPWGVTLCPAYPRFTPGGFSAVALLVRGDTDACFGPGAAPGATMPHPAFDHMARFPTFPPHPKLSHTS